MSGVEGGKELGLGNMIYRASDQTVDFLTIGRFKRPKAPDIKRLE
jgi:hypothetical protein